MQYPGPASRPAALHSSPKFIGRSAFLHRLAVDMDSTHPDWNALGFGPEGRSVELPCEIGPGPKRARLWRVLDVVVNRVWGRAQKRAKIQEK